MKEHNQQTSSYLDPSLIQEHADDLYEHAPCGYLSTLPNGLIVKINSTLLRWIGYESHEVLHKKKLQELFSIGGRIFYETHHAPLQKIQGAVNELNYDLIRKQGGLLPVLLTSVQLRDNHGQPILNRITVFDITDRKKYERELILARKKAEEAGRAKATFLSTVSHEFRTPMNAIIGIANLLQQTSMSPQQEKYIDVLKFSSQNLLNLINDILDFSKIEAGKVSLEEQYFNPEHLLRSILYGLQYKAEEKGICLELQLDDALPQSVFGDAGKLGQVITNLLANAIKFTDEGRVTLRLQLLDKDVHSARLMFRVQDTGIGISEDRLEKIFEEFTQASPEINLKYGGTGLGLSISQRLLDLFGSKLSVTSQLGRGSEFYFPLELPVDKAASEPETADNNDPISEPCIRGVRLLLAEDNAINVLVVSEYLHEWGVSFDVAADGAEALGLIQEYRYNMVLMDLQMPVMDGYQASRAIRSLEDAYYRNVPIVAFTASARFDYKERIEEAGITDMLSKPFRPDELKAVIVRWGLNVLPAVTLEQSPMNTHQGLEDMGDSDAEAPISLLQYQHITRNSPESLDKLLLLTIEHFQAYKINFAEALLNRDEDKMGELSHKIKMTLHLLEATALQGLISSSRQRIATAEHAELQQAAFKIQRALDQAIIIMKQHLIA